MLMDLLTCNYCNKGKIRPLHYSTEYAIISCDNESCDFLFDNSPWECIVPIKKVETEKLPTEYPNNVRRRNHRHSKSRLYRPPASDYRYDKEVESFFSSTHGSKILSNFEESNASPVQFFASPINEMCSSSVNALVNCISNEHPTYSSLEENDENFSSVLAEDNAYPPLHSKSFENSFCQTNKNDFHLDNRENACFKSLGSANENMGRNLPHKNLINLVNHSSHSFDDILNSIVPFDKTQSENIDSRVLESRGPSTIIDDEFSQSIPKANIPNISDNSLSMNIVSGDELVHGPKYSDPEMDETLSVLKFLNQYGRENFDPININEKAASESVVFSGIDTSKANCKTANNEMPPVTGSNLLHSVASFSPSDEQCYNNSGIPTSVSQLDSSYSIGSLPLINNYLAPDTENSGIEFPTNNHCEQNCGENPQSLVQTTQNIIEENSTSYTKEAINHESLVTNAQNGTSQLQKIHTPDNAFINCESKFLPSDDNCEEKGRTSVSSDFPSASIHRSPSRHQQRRKFQKGVKIDPWSVPDFAVDELDIEFVLARTASPPNLPPKKSSSSPKFNKFSLENALIKKGILARRAPKISVAHSQAGKRNTAKEPPIFAEDFPNILLRGKNKSFQNMKVYSPITLLPEELQMDFQFEILPYVNIFHQIRQSVGFAIDVQDTQPSEPLRSDSYIYYNNLLSDLYFDEEFSLNAFNEGESNLEIFANDQTFPFHFDSTIEISDTSSLNNSNLPIEVAHDKLVASDGKSLDKVSDPNTDSSIPIIPMEEDINVGVSPEREPILNSIDDIFYFNENDTPCISTTSNDILETLEVQKANSSDFLSDGKKFLKRKSELSELSPQKHVKRNKTTDNFSSFNAKLSLTSLSKRLEDVYDENLIYQSDLHPISLPLTTSLNTISPDEFTIDHFHENFGDLKQDLELFKNSTHAILDYSTEDTPKADELTSNSVSCPLTSFHASRLKYYSNLPDDHSTLSSNSSYDEVLALLRNSGWAVIPCNPVINYKIVPNSKSPTVIPSPLKDQYGNLGSNTVLWAAVEEDF